MRKVVVLGDSIAKGIIRDTPAAKYRISSTSFAKNCEKLMDIKIDNHAHLGSTVKQGFAIFQRIEDKVSKADEAWLLFGGNDSNMDLTNVDSSPKEITYQPRLDLKEFQEQYGLMISQLQDMKVNVTLLSLPPIATRKFMTNVLRTIHTPLGRCKWQKFIHHQPETLLNWHEMYNLTVFKLAHKHQVPIIDITTPFLQKGSCEAYFCDDGIHPNNYGHSLITNAITAARPDLVITNLALLKKQQTVDISG